jgi:hypothetical protein
MVARSRDMPKLIAIMILKEINDGLVQRKNEGQ